MLILLVFDKAPVRKSIILLLTTSECFHRLHYLQCQYPLCQSNDTINHPKHILIRIYLLTHQLNIRTTIELSKKCSENSSLKIWNQCHIHIECNRWICLENQLCGFYFKITLTGNELSIPNHEIHGFSNSFQLKMKKITMQTDWPNTFLPTTWERSFEEMFFVESQRQLWCII